MKAEGGWYSQPACVWPTLCSAKVGKLKRRMCTNPAKYARLIDVVEGKGTYDKPLCTQHAHQHRLC